MRRGRFVWKLYTGYAAVILLICLLQWLLVARLLIRGSHEAAAREVAHVADLLAELARDALAGDAAAVALDVRLRRLGDSTGLRYTVTDACGRALADSHLVAASMDSLRERQEVRAAAQSGHGEFLRRPNGGGQLLLFHARSVDVGQRRLGFVRVGSPLYDEHDGLSDLRWILACSAVLGMAVALVSGLLLARRVTDPIKSMTARARTIAAGGYHQRIAVSGRDETARLGEALNAMTDQLESRLRSLQEEKGKLQAILSSMVEGVLAVDRRECLLHLNQTAAAILRIEVEDGIGRPFLEVCRSVGMDQTLRDALAGQGPRHAELDLSGAHRSRCVQVHADAIRDAAGAVTGAVAVLHDITDLRELEKVRQDFVANVSHELKTPLTAILGITETLAGDAAMPVGTRMRFLERMIVQGRRLEQLVRDLLTLSRLESVDIGSDMGAVDLVAIAGRCCRTFADEAERKRIALELTTAADEVRVHGDGESLQQAVDNLINNAIRYTPAGGKVEVTVSCDGAMALVSVSDTGIGIAKVDRERIFERFYRVDKARSRELGGTGLGLSIVKHVARGHRGSVTVDSVLGKGSCFTLSLPCAWSVRSTQIASS